MKRNSTPLRAPLRVSPRIRKIASTMYGRIAVTYTACGKTFVGLLKTQDRVPKKAYKVYFASLAFKTSLCKNDTFHWYDCCDFEFIWRDLIAASHQRICLLWFWISESQGFIQATLKTSHIHELTIVKMHCILYRADSHFTNRQYTRGIKITRYASMHRFYGCQYNASTWQCMYQLYASTLLLVRLAIFF